MAPLTETDLTAVADEVVARLDAAYEKRAEESRAKWDETTRELREKNVDQLFGRVTKLEGLVFLALFLSLFTVGITLSER